MRQGLDEVLIVRAEKDKNPKRQRQSVWNAMTFPMRILGRCTAGKVPFARFGCNRGTPVGDRGFVFAPREGTDERHGGDSFNQGRAAAAPPIIRPVGLAMSLTRGRPWYVPALVACVIAKHHKQLPCCFAAVDVTDQGGQFPLFAAPRTKCQTP